MSLQVALFEVFTPLAAAFAVLSGVIFGLAVGWISVNPRYSAGTAAAIRVGILATVFAASAGLIFFALQTLAAYLGRDPLWTRVPSRYGTWLLFSATIGLTTFLLVRRDRIRRRRRAHDRAVSVSEIERDR